MDVSTVPSNWICQLVPLAGLQMAPAGPVVLGLGDVGTVEGLTTGAGDGLVDGAGVAVAVGDGVELSDDVVVVLLTVKEPVTLAVPVRTTSGTVPGLRWGTMKQVLMRPVPLLQKRDTTVVSSVAVACWLKGHLLP